jgi:hypothetical protein
MLALALLATGLVCTGDELVPPANPASSSEPDRTIIAAGSGSTEPGATTTDMLRAMAMLAGQTPAPEQLSAWAEKIDGGASVDGFIDEILASRRFGAEIVPTLVFGSFVNVRNYYALPSGFTLKQTTEGGERVYYLREPCGAGEAVRVHPWWDLSTEVRVCPDSYRPEKWVLTPGEHSYRSRMPLSCDSQVGSPELEAKSLCGCGPNLIRCLRDDDHYEELNKSLMAEVKQTTAYVVDHDLPIETLFTGNSSFRDRNVEMYYRRQKIGALQIADSDKELASLDAWPAEGQWAPREEQQPGQHAGMLTAPQILHSLPDRRQRQRGYYEIMWCAMRNSFGATTKKVLETNTTGNLAFVHDSWQKLAHTPLCTNCHARLDYGFQFFMGYPDSRASTHFDPPLASHDKGELYGRDIDDLRGTAPLTPAGFAGLAVQQPEFKSCMANHFVSYVLGDRATEDDRHAIESAVGESDQFKAVMKVALERYAVKWREASQAAPKARVEPIAVAPAGAPPKVVAIPPALRKQLDGHCVDCHDKGTYTDAAETEDVRPFDFRPDRLPRALLVRMTDQVAFGMMPKDDPLDDPDREEVVTALIDTLWATPQARAEAERYYLGRGRGLPAQQFDNALDTIDGVAGARPHVAWGALERGLWPDQSTVTPGFLAVMSLEALGACKQAHPQGSAALHDCLVDATSLRGLSRWPFHVR